MNAKKSDLLFTNSPILNSITGSHDAATEFKHSAQQVGVKYKI